MLPSLTLNLFFCWYRYIGIGIKEKEEGRHKNWVRNEKQKKLHTQISSLLNAGGGRGCEIQRGWMRYFKDETLNFYHPQETA